MFTVYPLKVFKILYNRSIETIGKERFMAVLTLKSSDFKRLPHILQEYASNMVTIKGNSEKTVCEYLLDLRTFFRYMKMCDSKAEYIPSEFEKIEIKDIDTNYIAKIKAQDIINFLMYAGFERENSTTTRMRKLSSIKSFFKYVCNKKHYIENNPSIDIDAPRKNKVLPKYLTLSEARLLLDTIKNDTESKSVVRDYTIVTLFLNTGMRLSELVGLNLQSFDRDLSTVKVLGKGNKERIIYLNNAAKETTASYIKTRLDPRYIRTSDNAFFLSQRQTRISVKTVQWMIYKYLDMAGLGSRGFSVHKLRHTAATLMYQSGNVDIRVLKDILGHEQLNTTQIYTHVVSASLEEAMNNNPLADLTSKK